MDIFIKLSQFFSLSLLIVLTKDTLFRLNYLKRVEKFYLFFDVKYSLLKKKIGDTGMVSVGYLGGYVKIS
jgi:regulator of sigma E protease